MKKIITLFLLCCVNILSYANVLKIVAAENIYGDLAKKIGGDQVTVISILSNPNQDPHLFSTDPNTAKAIEQADMLIYNGIEYDPWMKKLIAPQSHKTILVISELSHKQSGDNPHIWYNPHTILTYVTDLTQKLSQLGVKHASVYQKNLNDFKKQYQLLQNKILSLKQRYQNTPVIATEPVFNEMATLLGLKMYGQTFQINMMNGTEPSIRDTKEFQDMLTQRRVKLLIYNNQVKNPLTEKLKALATQSGIPVLGVSETQPPDQDYFGWMNKTLEDLEAALS